MEIPKYKDIDPQVRHLDKFTLFDMMMTDFATHQPKHLLEDMVCYVKQSGIDLSKEIWEVAHNSKSLSVFVEVAQHITKLQDKQLLGNKRTQSKDSKLSDHKFTAISSSKAKDTLDETRLELINLLECNSFIGINVSLVTSDERLYHYCINTPNTLGTAYLDLGLLQHVLRKIFFKMLNGGDTGNSSDDKPQGPTGMGPVEEATRILKNS